MIKINDFTKEYENEFYQYVEEQVIKRIRQKLKTLKNQSLISFLNYIEDNLKDIILSDIEKTKQNIESYKIKNQIKIDKNYKETMKYIFDYKEIITKNMSFSHKLAKKMNSNICPYCNKNYTEFVENRRRFDFDHFYPKSKYPYLALSLYNLIPICKDCNENKGQEDFNKITFIYPYEEGVEEERIFTYKYNGNIDEYTIINCSHNKKYINNEKALNITDRYQGSSNRLKELKDFYNRSKGILKNKEAMKILNIKDINDLKKYLGYTEISDIRNKPISKLQNDIIDEFIENDTLI